MASVHKDPRGKSPYWTAYYYGADGRRKSKSTKLTKRGEALERAVEWEKLAKKARKGELTAAQARKVVAEMVAASTGETLEFYTTRGWFDYWLENKAGGSRENTMKRYKQVARDFLDCMGPKADASLAAVTPHDIVVYRDRLRKEGRAVSTCNNVVKKILSVPFEQARKMGFIPTNPVAAVDPIKDRDEEKVSGREPFGLGEVPRILALASDDWEGATILGATSGLRLGDVANLVEAFLDLSAGVLRVDTEKTGVVVVVPIHPDFREWLEKRPRGVGLAPIFPSLFGKPVSGAGGLSAQFRKIMKKAGIVERVVERKGKGRTGYSKGFHSLRHTFVSSLANAGVAPDIRQKLAGHADEKVHAGYTHHETEVLRQAVAKLPSLKAS